MYHLTKYAFFIVLLSLFGLRVSAQKKDFYNGTVSIRNSEFIAEYEYTIRTRGDTLLNGLYKLNKSIEAVRDNENFDFFNLNGNFKEDKSDGNWEWRSGTLKPTSKGIYNDKLYSFKVSGNESFTSGKFKNGEKVDIWKIFEWTIEDSQIKDTLLMAELPFQANAIMGEFNIFRGNEHLKGNIGSQGFAADKWKFSLKMDGGETVIREWLFKEGQLIERTLMADGKTHKIQIKSPETPNSTLVELEMDERYFDIINLISAIEYPVQYKIFKSYPKTVDTFFHEILNYIQTKDSLLNDIADVKYTPAVRTFLRKYKFNDLQNETFDEIKKSLQSTESIINEVKTDPQINIAKLSRPEVMWLLQVVDSFQDTNLNPLKEIIRLKEIGHLEFVNVEKYISVFIRPTAILKVEDTKKLAGTYELLSLQSNTPITNSQQLLFHIQKLEKEALIMSDSLKLMVSEFKKEEKLIDAETELMTRIDNVKALNAATITDTHSQFANFEVEDAINQFITNELAKYSKIASSEDKQAGVNGLIQCIDNVEQLIQTLENVPDNIYIVRDAYTRQSFNPYTLSTMEEKIKGPIYKAYEELILPATFKNVKSMGCSTIVETTNNFKVLFQSMINLINQDTRKLEQSLKKVNTPQRAADLLDFKLKLN